MDKVQLNKTVTNIKWNSESDSERVSIKCSDGSEYKADHVIVTIPLGVLKKNHKTLFTPELPQSKQKVINAFGFGTIGKIYLEFEEPFWSTDVNVWSNFIFTWSDADLAEILGTDKAWLEGLFTFVRVDYFPKLICGFVAGEQIEMFEQLTDEKIMEDCNWLFDKFFGKTLKLGYLIGFNLLFSLLFGWKSFLISFVITVILFLFVNVSIFSNTKFKEWQL